MSGMLSGERLSGEEARELRGTVFLAFPDFEVEGVELYQDSAVRAYLRAIHDAIPHLFYFLSPEIMVGSVEAFLWAYLTEEEFDGQKQGPIIRASGIAVERLIDRFAAAAAFATDKGDDWRVVVEPLLERFPPGPRTDIMSRLEELVLSQQPS
jgi:hypothetical protein